MKFQLPYMPERAVPLGDTGRQDCVVTLLEVDDTQAVRILYTNHEGKTAWRRIVPLPLPPRFNATPFHGAKWTITVWDLDKQAVRDYCLEDIHGSHPVLPPEDGQDLAEVARRACR